MTLSNDLSSIRLCKTLNVLEWPKCSVIIQNRAGFHYCRSSYSVPSLGWATPTAPSSLSRCSSEPLTLFKVPPLFIPRHLAGQQGRTLGQPHTQHWYYDTYVLVSTYNFWLVTPSLRQATETRVFLPQQSPNNSNLPWLLSLGTEFLWLLGMPPSEILSAQQSWVQSLAPKEIFPNLPLLQ